MSERRTRHPLPSDRSDSRVTRWTYGFISLVLGSVLSAILGIVLYNSGATDLSNPYNRPVRAQSKQPIDAEYIAEGVQARTKFPVVVDDVTNLSYVSGVADTLIYHYTAYGVTIPDPEEFERNIHDSMCESPDIKDLISQGFDIRNEYSDPQGILLQSVTINTVACGNQP